MEEYSQKPITFLYFWLKNYCNGNHNIERIPIAMKDIDHLFSLASEIIEADRLHLFLLSDGTQIDDNEYLESLENSTELIVSMEEQIQKLLFYFELKRYLNIKNISYPVDIDYFLILKITLFIEAVQAYSCSKCFLIVFKYDSEQAKRV